MQHPRRKKQTSPQPRDKNMQKDTEFAKQLSNRRGLVSWRLVGFLVFFAVFGCCLVVVFFGFLSWFFVV